jgi:hypothetical protein
MRLGVTSSGRAPSTGVAGALPLLHAFSYEVSETGEEGQMYKRLLRFGVLFRAALPSFLLKVRLEYSYKYCDCGNYNRRRKLHVINDFASSSFH